MNRTRISVVGIGAGFRIALAGLLLAILVGATVSPAAAEHEQNNGIDPATGWYISPQLNYMYAWDAPWANMIGETISVEGGFDRFVLWNGTALFSALGFQAESAPEEVLEFAIEPYADRKKFEVVAKTVIEDVEISKADAVTTVPSATVTYEDVPFGGTDVVPMATYMEVHPVIANGSIDNPLRLLVSLDAPVDKLEEAFASVLDAINADPTGFTGRKVFYGAPEIGGGRDDDRTNQDDANSDDSDDDSDREEDKDTRDEDDTRGAGGEGYVSPTYGYTVEFDADVWEITDESSKGDVDVVELTNGTSDVRISGLSGQRNVRKCLATALEDLLDRRAYADFAQAEDTDGNPFAGETDTRSYTVYTDGEDAVYLQCEELSDGVFLVIQMDVAVADFNDEIDALDDLLAGVAFDAGAAGEPTAEASDDDEAGDEKTTADEDTTKDDDSTRDEASGTSSGNSYEDAAFDWSVEWSDDWKVDGDPEKDGFLTLDNGVSTVQFIPMEDYNGNAERCVRDQLALLTDGEGVSGVSAFRFGGETVKGGDEAASFAAYRYSFKAGGTTVKMVQYYDCRTLAEGESVLLTVQIVTQDDYESQVEPFQELLSGLSVPGPAAADDEDDDAA